MSKEQKSRIMQCAAMLAVAAGVVGYGFLKIFVNMHPQEGAYASLAGLTLAVGIPLLGLYAFLSICRSWTIERVFPVVALTLGILMILALPTYSKPDEIAHFDTAYNLSSRMLGRDGCEVWFFMETRSVDNKYLKTVLETDVYDEYYGMFAPMEEETYQLERINHKTDATLAAVIPAVGVSVARLLHLNFGWVCLFGTLCQLLFYTAAVTYAIHKIPVGKQVVFVAALLPMTMQQACSFSYDCELFAAAFVVTALSFHWRKNGWKRGFGGAGEIAAYLASVLFLFTVKSGVYLFLALLPLVLCMGRRKGGRRAGNKKKVMLVGGIVLIIALAAILFVSVNAAALGRLLGRNAYIREFDAYAYSAMYHLHHPKEAFAMLFRTLFRYGGYYVLTTVGGLLGNLDIQISKKVILALLLLLLLSMLSAAKEKPEFTKGQRAGTIVLAAIPCVLAVISMWLYWTPLDLTVIQGIQGRYFLPSLPALMIGAGLWKRPAFVWKRETVNRWLGFAAIALNYMAVICIYIAVGLK